MIIKYPRAISFTFYSIVFCSVFVLMTACGGSEDGDGGTGVDNPQTSADVMFTTVAMLSSNVNDATAYDAGPEVSSDYLELYFFSDRVGGSGGMDIYVSTRAHVTDPWGLATNVTALNTSANERQPSLSSDGLSMYFASDRAGGEGGMDLYVSTRASLADAWSTPVNLGTVVNTSATESGPGIADDGLSLYFQSDRIGGLGVTDLYVATRATMVDLWDTPANLGASVNSAEFEVAPDIASDGLSLLFHSTRAGGEGFHDIWRATRANTSDPWNAPVNLGAPVNSPVPDTAPGLSDDWQTLYFSSDISGNRDIWEAHP